MDADLILENGTPSVDTTVTVRKLRFLLDRDLLAVYIGNNNDVRLTRRKRLQELNVKEYWTNCILTQQI